MDVTSQKVAIGYDLVFELVGIAIYWIGVDLVCHDMDIQYIETLHVFV